MLGAIVATDAFGSSRHFILCPIHMAIPSFFGHSMGHT